MWTFSNIVSSISCMKYYLLTAYFFGWWTIFWIKCNQALQQVESRRISFREFFREWDWLFLSHVANISPRLIISDLSIWKRTLFIIRKMKITFLDEIYVWSNSFSTNENQDYFHSITTDLGYCFWRWSAKKIGHDIQLVNNIFPGKQRLP